MAHFAGGGVVKQTGHPRRLSAVEPRFVRLAVFMLVVGACSPAPPPTSQPMTQTTLGPASAAPTPRSSLDALDAGTPRCPPRPFDPAASLGPEFDEDIFLRDESKAIATEFLVGLASIYANPSADVCRYFTAQGWRTALAFDPRLRAVERGESLVTQEHLLRVAFEGSYNLRDRPPVIPVDIVFDIPAGAATKDVPSGETRTTTSTAREGSHADFMFDGHRWRVDRLGPISEDYRRWVELPSTPPPGQPCADFVRDPKGSPFDENADRRWCDAAGRGRVISRNQLNLFTRYPCDHGHAAILQIGRPLGATFDPLVHWEYVRDPANEFLERQWVTERFDGAATLPDDAADSGWTNGNIDLWLSPSDLDRAVYIVRNGTVERWPRAAAGWGVIDCN